MTNAMKRVHGSGFSRLPVVVGLALTLTAVSGCSRFTHHKSPDKYVYVTAKEAYLRDRVAAVSNRSGEVQNGEQLRVLDRSRRFVKVRSPRGEEGWLDERNVATQEVEDKFQQLNEAHAKDSVVGQATTRDEVYLHAAPGRETDRFYRLNEGQKLAMLDRASIEKAVPAASTKAAVATEPKKAAEAKGSAAEAPAGPPAPVYEDWWLVRTPEGHTGWIYSHMMDVDAPDTLLRYAEGQRIVGAYVLTHVNDPESGQLKDGQPDPDIPEYVTVLSPYKAGLPFDFNQVRVFSWNVKKHRYETAFRDRNIEGYLPLKVLSLADPAEKGPLGQEKLPAFQYTVLAAEAPQPTPDPKTGELKPAKLITKTYRLEGSIVRRVLPPGATAPAEAHPEPEPEKKGKKGKKR